MKNMKNSTVWGLWCAVILAFFVLIFQEVPSISNDARCITLAILDAGILIGAAINIKKE